jgi:hypothetical protein
MFIIVEFSKETQVLEWFLFKSVVEKEKEKDVGRSLEDEEGRGKERGWSRVVFLILLFTLAFSLTF